jgi:hypothetical protein
VAHHLAQHEFRLRRPHRSVPRPGARLGAGLGAEARRVHRPQRNGGIVDLGVPKPVPPGYNPPKHGKARAVVMTRLILIAATLLLIAGCAQKAPPPNLDNACAIVDDRPSWYRDMRRAERKWGVPVHVQLATVYQESKFVHDARTPYRWTLGIIPMGRQSTAFGYSQAIDSTWEWYLDATGNRGAQRTDFGDSTDFIGWYMNESTERLGIAKWDARNQYLAYHDGHTGYARGSYKSKGWLLRVSQRVADRAAMYQRQLAVCR